MGRSKEEIIKEMNDVRASRFMNAMNDHWSEEDRDFDRKCGERMAALAKELDDLEGDK